MEYADTAALRREAKAAEDLARQCDLAAPAIHDARAVLALCDELDALRQQAGVPATFIAAGAALSPQ